MALKHCKPDSGPAELEQLELEVGWTAERIGKLFVTVFWHLHYKRRDGASREITDDLGKIVKETTRNSGGPKALSNSNHSKDNCKRQQERYIPSVRPFDTEKISQCIYEVVNHLGLHRESQMVQNPGPLLLL